MKASSEGLETGDLRLIWSHHYHRPSDTITSAQRSPALQTAAPSLRLWQPSTFYCLYSANIHTSLPPITSQARIGIIFCNMFMEFFFFCYWLESDKTLNINKYQWARNSACEKHSSLSEVFMFCCFITTQGDFMLVKEPFNDKMKTGIHKAI